MKVYIINNNTNRILKTGIILTIILLTLLSCTRETQSYKLNLNENTYLLDGKPYTGMVIDKQRKSGRIISSWYFKTILPKWKDRSVKQVQIWQIIW